MSNSVIELASEYPSLSVSGSTSIAPRPRTPDDAIDTDRPCVSCVSGGSSSVGGNEEEEVRTIGSVRKNGIGGEVPPNPESIEDTVVAEG
jgi:hypothetical protein